MNDIESLLNRTKESVSAKDYENLEALVQTAVYLTQAVENKNTSLARLRKLLFGPTTEKTRDVVKDKPDTGKNSDSSQTTDSTPSATSTTDKSSPTPARKGHGRNGCDAYHNAEKIQVPHDNLESGDPCPNCKNGTVYEQAAPGVLVRIVGRAPLQAKIYELQKLRCNLCGQVFTAQSPEGVGSKKYDATAASMIALLKYGSGLPFNRLQGLQNSLGIPLPASTQWDIVHATAIQIAPVYRELIRQAAAGKVLHNDDTTMKILDLMGKRAKRPAFTEEGMPNRKGIFTSGIVSVGQDRRIALFFTGNHHAGENLKRVLSHRAAALSAPIQMCDALSRNLPAEFETIVANCLAHGRRQFVDVAGRFPDECCYVLEILGEVYMHDADALKQGLSPDQRLDFHRTHSGPLMERLHRWLGEQFDQKKVEPNSGLGQAISYMLKHWERLSLFLREPGAPLDNNVCERALKKAILHRKNSLFYKSEKGAHVGDLYMSVIYTCQLCNADPFDYLSTLQENAASLVNNAKAWMPWNYRQASRSDNPKGG